MWEHTEVSRQLVLIALAVMMLAVPFSCTLTKAVLWCFEPRHATRSAGREMPLHGHI